MLPTKYLILHSGAGERSSGYKGRKKRGVPCHLSHPSVCPDLNIWIRKKKNDRDGGKENSKQLTHQLPRMHWAGKKKKFER